MGRRVLVASGACALLLAASGPASTVRAAAGQAVVAQGVYRALAHGGRARVVVALRPRVAGRSLTSARAVVAGAQRRVLARVGRGLSLGRRYRAIPALAGRIDRAGLRRLASSPDVAAVALDQRVHAELAQSVPLIHADVAHSQAITGAGVTVAVLDTGIDTDHPALADSIVGQACFVTHEDGSGGCPGGATRAIGPGTAEDDEGHGTSVAGIITGNGSATRPVGVAPGAGIVAVKVLARDGSGLSSDVLAGIDWIIDDNPEVDLVNLSLGSDTLFGSACDTANADARADASAFDALRSRGVLAFAASGNDGSPTSIAEPACIAGVVSVGAVYDAALGAVGWEGCSDASTAPDQVTCFSDAAPSLDLLAPGAVIDDVPVIGGYDEFDGTSAATPHATGVAALLLQARPDLTPVQVEQALKAGPVVLDPRDGLSFHRVDAKKALDALASVSSEPGPTFLPDTDVTYTEPTGDTSSGPDLGSVTVRSRRGILTFTMRAPNRATLPKGESIEVRIDTDRNAATGDPNGFEQKLVFTDGGVELERWSAPSWVDIRPLAIATAGSGVFTVEVSQEELGIGGDFTFGVSAAGDLAPASGKGWPFPAFPVTVTKSGTGSGTVSGGAIDCGSVCSAPVGRGASITLTASPGANSVFAGWGSPCGGTGACHLTVTAATQVQARFERMRRLAVSLRGLGRGTVTSSPGGIDCGSRCGADFANGSKVTLTPHAAAGSRFVDWTGACAGTGACALDLEGPTSVQARFADIGRPTARALATSVRRGAFAQLRFRLSDNSGRAGATVTVARGSHTLATLRDRLGRTRGLASVLWRAPAATARGRLRFCVRPVDGSGNKGKRSCAALRVR